MEELVASMEHSVHVGRQAYDISNLQNQLNKTLAYSNPYQFTHQPPLDATATTESRHSFGSDMRHSLAPATKPTRPMMTPTTSFRGSTSGGAAHQPWSTEGSCSTEARQEVQWGTSCTSTHPGQAGDYHHTGMEGVQHHPPPPTTKPDDYSAFEHDAFAPLHTTSSANNHQSTTGIPADPWAAFRSRLPSAIGNVNGGTQHQERPWMQNTNHQQSKTWHHHQGLVGSTYQNH